MRTWRRILTIVAFVGMITVVMPAASSAVTSPPFEVSTFPAGGQGSLPGQMDSPTDIAASPLNGDIYIVERDNHRVSVFDRAGNFLFKFSSQGVTDGRLTSPTYLDIDEKGKVFVLDTGNNRVQVFTKGGVFVRGWGTGGTGLGQFDEPSGIAIHPTKNRVYVLDNENSRVQFFTKDGSYIDEFELSNPTSSLRYWEGLAISPVDHNVLVNWTLSSDHVQIYTEDGVGVGVIPHSGSLYGSVEVDTHNRVYVGDGGSDGIWVYEMDGSLITSWDANINTPDGVHVDPSGKVILVADSFGYRVKIFTDVTCRGQVPDIVGSSYDDVIHGTSGADRIATFDGRDKIYGEGGPDILCGGFGVDKIYGGPGDDLIIGGGGSDRIWGGNGADTIEAGSGADRVWGGSQADDLQGQGGQDTMYGEDGNDNLQGNDSSDFLDGGDGNDTVAGAKGKDELYGQAGDDALFGGENSDDLFGGPGNDSMSGGPGSDTCSGGSGTNTRNSC